MPTKRPRIGRSSTNVGDTDVMLSPPPRRAAGVRVPAAGNSAKALKAADAEVVEERSGETRPKILTVSSPVQRSEVGPRAGFLERCFACNKVIAGNADVFMYSLHAFCSVECRDRQVILDEVEEVASTACKRRTT